MSKKINNNLIVALDIGTSKVVAIVADVLPDGTLDIVGVGMQPSSGMKKGVVVNIDATVESVRRAIEEAELVAGCQIHSVYTGIAGSHIRSMNSHGIVAVKGNEVTQNDIDRVIEAGRAVVIPADQKILHVLPQEFILDHQAEIKDPLGMSGIRLEAKIHIVTGSVTAAQNIVSCIRRCNLDVDDLILEQLASSYAVLTEDEKQLGVCLVDIGGGTADIAVFAGGALQHTSVIPVAGDQVTNDLAVALRTSTADAERIKIEHGCAFREVVVPDHWVEVPDAGENEILRVQQFDLARVLEPRYEELFALVNAELQKIGLSEQLAAGVVLTGGSSKMLGVVELAQAVFQLPVRLGVPRQVSGMHEVVRNPIYATGVGLLLYGLRNQHLSRSSGTQNNIRSWFGRVKHWFHGNF